MISQEEKQREGTFPKPISGSTALSAHGNTTQATRYNNSNKNNTNQNTNRTANGRESTFKAGVY